MANTRTFGGIKIDAKSGFFYLRCNSNIDGKSSIRHSSPAFKYRLNAEKDVSTNAWKTFLGKPRSRGKQDPYIPYDPVPPELMAEIGNQPLIDQVEDAMDIVPPPIVNNVIIPLIFQEKWSVWVHQAKVNCGDDEQPLSMLIGDFLQHRPGFWSNAPQSNNNSKFRMSTTKSVNKYGFLWR